LVSYIYLWYKTKQRFRAEVFQIPPHRQALSLGVSWSKITIQIILSMTFWITNNIIAAYIISTLVFLILIVFFKRPRQQRNVFLNKANLLIVFVLLLNIIFVGVETIKCLVYENSSSLTFIENTDTINSRNCTAIFITTFFFAFLFHSLFFFNRHRIKVSYTIISILLLTFVYNYERLIIYITSLYRDYLPSSWSTYYDWTGSLWIAIFAASYFAFCWTNKLTLNKRKM
jgi:hypothetical protein